MAAGARPARGALALVHVRALGARVPRPALRTLAPVARAVLVAARVQAARGGLALVEVAAVGVGVPPGPGRALAQEPAVLVDTPGPRPARRAQTLVQIHTLHPSIQYRLYRSREAEAEIAKTVSVRGGSLGSCVGRNLITPNTKPQSTPTVLTTHPSVGVSRVSLLAGTAVVPREVRAEGIGAAGRGAETLVNICSTL